MAAGTKKARIWCSGLLLGSLLLGGCLSDGDEENAGEGVKLTDVKLSPSTVKAGGSVEVEGTATFPAGLTKVEVTVWKGDSDVTVGKGFTVTQKPLDGAITGWDLKTDGKARIDLTEGVPIGDYTVKVLAKSNEDSTTAAVALKVDGTEVVMQEVTLGSNQNATGGSVDLDEMKVYIHAEAAPISDKIDLYYGHSATEGDKLFSPLQASISGFGLSTGGPATWDKANATIFRKVTLSDTAFAAISTQEAIDDLWDEGTLVIGDGDVVAVGSTYIVNTDLAKKVLVRVTAYVEGDTGTLTIKGSK